MERQDDLQNYRDLLTELEQKSYEDYDKALLTMSGGALAISFAFLKNIVGEDPVLCRSLLIIAWSLWTATILTVISSFLISQRAFRKAIKQLDNGKKETELGGIADKFTHWLNLAGGIFFLLGVILMVIFASYNFGESHGSATPCTEAPKNIRV